MLAISTWCAWALIASSVFDRSGKHARHYGNSEKSGNDDLRQDKPDWDCHGRAASFRRNDGLLNLFFKGVVVFPGSGITENLIDRARQLSIPVRRVNTRARPQPPGPVSAAGPVLLPRLTTGGRAVFARTSGVVSGGPGQDCTLVRSAHSRTGEAGRGQTRGPLRRVLCARGMMSGRAHAESARHVGDCVTALLRDQPFLRQSGAETADPRRRFPRDPDQRTAKTSATCPPGWWKRTPTGSRPRSRG